MAAATNPWWESELAGCTFADARLGQRLQKIIERMDGAIGSSLPLACQDWANTKAAYRFFSNDRVSEDEILAGHFGSTRERTTAAEGTILVLQDTTEFTYQRESPEAIGITYSVNSGKDKAGRLRTHTVCGLLMHSSLAVTTDGLPLGGSVANSGSGRSDRRSPKISGGNSEQAGNEGGLRLHVAGANVMNLALSDHRHHFVASKCPSSSWQAPEAEPRSHQPFDPAMILLDDVVQVFALAQPREAPQLASSLHVCRGTRVGRVPVHRDRTWVHRVRLGQRLAEEPLGRIGISPGGQQEVDGLAEAVDRAIQVGPGTLDLDIRLVDPPRSGAWPQVAPDALFELGGIGLHPPEQGGVVDRDTPVRQHGGEIAIADREGQIPPQCP